MANLAYTASATLNITGIVPAEGPTSTIKIGSAYSGVSTPADDWLSETYVVNAGTVATAINLGKIVTGQMLWVQCNGPLNITLTTALGDVILPVASFIMLQTPFTALKLANAGADAVEVSVTVCGARTPVGTGPGIF